ncbi:chromosomal replication initiator protein DnaA [Floccifex sp.]|uniref:chromosomal replication initiator protein DnaA n=1 Tax=Floccifex sp. TaxID=2815810 RepID=UPI002A7624AE|nr:chromosomal replication initiator protein DnaA [Floccifex sp.]MDD7280560.1 chromosomal replication initiator protein DnaA [Erysipelotrichaceae bacterium]MDY2958627.1 chromosomal replication initiator protein DnaA [Floccifex sp.]
MTSYQELWKNVLKSIEDAHFFKGEVFNTWIVNKTELVNINDDNSTAYVSYGSTVTNKVVSDNKELFEATLSELYGSTLAILLVDRKEADSIIPQTQPSVKAIKIEQTPFDENYTFENFVQGYCNQEAYAACLSCCTQKKHIFNPIMIYGNPGLGKTHLLHAIGNFLKKERPEVKVFYAYAGDLVKILLDAMRTKNVYGNAVEQVKEQLASYDYFLIDDVQNLNQSSSQEVFFSVYNQLISHNAQIVMTSDMHPNELKGIQDRLVSRFSSGLVTNISKPEFDTSKAILQKKLEKSEDTVLVQEDVLDYLASKFSDDVRNLEGSLNKLLFNAIIEHPDVIDLEFAQRILMKEPVILNQNELTMKQIKKAVISFYGFTYKDIEGKSRQKNIMNARQVFVYLCREMLHKAYVAIGQELGNRDHTTILSSYERACQKMETDPAFKLAVEKVKAMLTSQ